MSNQKDYVPVQLIIKIGDCLLAVDGLGHQVYSARYLEKNHLSGRAQDHFRHHEIGKHFEGVLDAARNRSEEMSKNWTFFILQTIIIFLPDFFM